MEWMAIGLVPLLTCGVMCVGGVVLAALGLRRASDPRCHDASRHVHDERDEIPVR